MLKQIMIRLKQLLPSGHVDIEDINRDSKVLDVWSFRALERLKVHEDRTYADCSSCAIPKSRSIVDVYPTKKVA